MFTILTFEDIDDVISQVCTVVYVDPVYVVSGTRDNPPPELPWAS